MPPPASTSIAPNLKSCDRYIRLAILTGVSRFSRLSIFSDINNLDDISMDSEFAAICGITEEEMLRDCQPGIQRLADYNEFSYDEAVARLKNNYATSSPEQIRYILRDSKARIIIVGNTKQYEAVCSVIDECPEVHCAVLIDGTLPADEPSKYRALTWADLVTIGATAGENIRHTVTSRRDAATGDDIATLIYTSGTTGEPKGAILTHSCFDAAMEIHRQRLTSISDRDTSLCFLPLSCRFSSISISILQFTKTPLFAYSS